MVPLITSLPSKVRTLGLPHFPPLRQGTQARAAEHDRRAVFLGKNGRALRPGLSHPADVDGVAVRDADGVHKTILQGRPYQHVGLVPLLDFGPPRDGRGDRTLRKVRVRGR